MTVHAIQLLGDDSHEMSYFFFEKYIILFSLKITKTKNVVYCSLSFKIAHRALDNMNKHRALDNMNKQRALDNMNKQRALDNMNKHRALDNMKKQ